jgi:hypothetical protein
MCFPEQTLFLFTSRQILVHFRAMPEIERDGAVDLLERQRGKGRTDRLRGLTALELPHDADQWHTAPHQVKAVVPPLDEVSLHAHCTRVKDASVSLLRQLDLAEAG